MVVIGGGVESGTRKETNDRFMYISYYFTVEDVNIMLDASHIAHITQNIKAQNSIRVKTTVLVLSNDELLRFKASVTFTTFCRTENVG